MGLVIKTVLGVLIVLLIGALAKTKNYHITGLISPFLTFALIAHHIVANECGIEVLRVTIISSMWSVTPYFAYLVPLQYFTGMICLSTTFVGSITC